MNERRKPSLAPWLPPRRTRRCGSLQWLCGVFGSLLLLLYVAIIGLLFVLCYIPVLLLQLLLTPALRRFGYVVEYAYSLGICKLHVTFEKIAQGCMGRTYHSRCADLRSELPLEVGGFVFVHPIPCLTANFAYLLVDASDAAVEAAREHHSGLRCCLVDPCDASTVVELVENLCETLYAEFGGLCLEAVLCTHKHWDHAGGNRELRAWAAASEATNATTGESGSVTLDSRLRYAEALPVYGGFDEVMPGRTHPLESGDIFQIGSLEIQAIAAPGHTAGSIVYCIRNLKHSGDSSSPGEAVFTGDCLFSGGCGAPFEGSELDMEHCFASILQHCDPKVTWLFPGHEYTTDLLEDRLSRVDDSYLEAAPGQFLALCGDFYNVSHRRRLHDKIPTVPCTMQGERHINPLLRTIQRRVQFLTDVCCELHALKDEQQMLPPPMPSHFTERSDMEKSLHAPARNSEGESSWKDEQLSLEFPASLNVTDNLGTETSEKADSPQERKEEDRSHDRDGGDSRFVLGPAVDGRKNVFSFLYRSELEEFCHALRHGRISNSDAATHLLELEKHVFEKPVLSGRLDSFGEAATPLEDGEERKSRKEEERQRLPNEEDANAPVGTRSFQEIQNRRIKLGNALKVLGVPPDVALGRKAPCDDDKLPVSLPRLLCLMYRFGVKDETLRLLKKRLLPAVIHSLGDGSQDNDVTNDRLCSQEPSAHECSQLLPLKEAMNILIPDPHQQSRCTKLRRFCGSFCKCIFGFARCICCCGCPCLQRKRVAGEARDVDAVKSKEEIRRRAFQEEATFAKHDLANCLVCRNSFSQRRRRVKRSIRLLGQLE